MTNYKTKPNAPDARDFLGNYLRKEDLPESTIATLIEVVSEAMPRTNKRKLVAMFEEFEKPLVLNATNIRGLTDIFGTTNTASWRGPVEVYVDNSVEYAGRVVGGLRIRRASLSSALEERLLKMTNREDKASENRG